MMSMDDPGRYTFHSTHDASTGRYVFDIQEMTISLSLPGEIPFGEPMPQGRNDWFEPTLSILNILNGGLAVATNCKEVIEWEYIRQARINRQLAQNYSTPIKHSMRAIKAVGKFIGVGSMVISWADYANNPTTGNMIQAIANTGLVFVRINPAIGIIIGISDVTGASDYIYDQIGDYLDNLDSSDAHQNVLKRGNLCFPGDMKVLMACGGHKRIDEIEIGDLVMAYDFDAETLTPTVVNRIDAPVHYEMVYLRFSKNVGLRSTQDHPIWVKGKGWASVNSELSTMRYDLDVSHLEVKDKCVVYMDRKKKTVRLKRIELYYERQKTYNLTILENGNSYIVNGIIVSNESNVLNY